MVLNVFALPEQIVVVPLIALGATGTTFITVIFNVRGEDEPQELFAVTAMFPPVAVAVALIEDVVEEPDQPEGNVQVYEVAPATPAMLYVFKLPMHTVVLPLMIPGVVGMVLIIVVIDAVAEQLLESVTVTM